MKRRHFVQWLVAAGLAACGKPPTLSPVGSGSSVLAFGDSVTYGTGAGRDEDWPSLLAQRTGWQIANAGIPGDTAEAAQRRIQAALDEHRPALVIVELGGNDFLRRRAAKAVKEDLRRIIRTVRQSGAQVVLVAVPEFSLLGVVARRPSDSPIYRELGEEEVVPVIDDVFSNILARPEWCADQIHPNAQGYREMAGGIHAALQQLGLARPA
ncbi:MAG: arylesterase [Betaproteobacteria bacterium HGW-Betaproteobacteria-12]|nr:MAG: arylesterase [Betaproteobacteria bacterium HGW-Betaproteobacteria-12]